MKDSFIIGMALGVVVGVIAYNNCPEVKRIFDKGEKAINKGMKQAKQKTN